MKLLLSLLLIVGCSHAKKDRDVEPVQSFSTTEVSEPARKVYRSEPLERRGSYTISSSDPSPSFARLFWSAFKTPILIFLFATGVGLFTGAALRRRSAAYGSKRVSTSKMV